MTNKTKDQFKKEILTKIVNSHHFALETEQDIALKGFKILLEGYVIKAEKPTIEGLIEELSLESMHALHFDEGNKAITEQAKVYLSTIPGFSYDEAIMGCFKPSVASIHTARMNYYVNLLWEGVFPY